MGSSPVGLKTPIGRARGLWNLSTDQEWKTPETEQECLEYYQEKIAHAQNKRLLPLQEDLADWLNKTLDLNHITATNLLDILDNGVILCHLARVIQKRAQDCSRYRDRYRVQQNQPRNVVLCLMEVSRIASRYNLEPPKLVALEKEIAEEESRELAAKWTPAPSNIKHSSSDGRMLYIQEGGCGVGESLRRTNSEQIAPDFNDVSPTDTTDDDWSRAPSIEDSSELDGSACGLNDLDIKLLKGRHMMVRVGGGWDTLEHFLQRHDPCQARVVSRPATPASSGKIPRPYSALQSYGVHSPSHAPHTLAR